MPEMTMLSRARRWLYRWGWDVRCRNIVPARLIAAHVRSGAKHQALLDVGCGGLGLAVFLPDTAVTGTDLTPPQTLAANLTFQVADVTRLPYADQQFKAVSCIDVLEHLPPESRQKALRELVRVAEEALIVACPTGNDARKLDAHFHKACQSRNVAAPSWVIEHLQQAPMERGWMAEALAGAADELGRKITCRATYCEPLWICRLIRACAVRSRLLYALANLCFGLFVPCKASSEPAGCYREIIFAEFSNAAVSSGSRALGAPAAYA